MAHSAIRQEPSGARLGVERSYFVWAKPGHTSTAPDPGCVKTPKERSRRGIVFYRRRGFRVVLQPLVTTLVLEKKVILCVLHALVF